MKGKNISIWLGSGDGNTYIAELLKYNGVIITNVCDINQSKISDVEKLIPVVNH